MRRAYAWIVLLSVLVAGCAPFGAAAPSADAVEPAGIPMCDDVPAISAPEAAYQDGPVYVANEMPVEAVQAWVAGKAGFEELWIDRDHNGWITLAFSRDADARQAELEAAFPDGGVVVVEVDWTMAELEELQQRVHTALSPRFDISSGILVMQGVVEIGLGPLTAERLAAAKELFAGERVCVAGFDATLLPAPGPQLGEGDGWRLLGSEESAGQAYRTGIATDSASLRTLWADAGLTAEAPAVDFENEVAIWFGAVFGSSCPGLRLDGVAFDHTRAIVHAEIVNPEPHTMCTADANPHAFVVAVPRSRLPPGPFWIQLGAEGPPGGAPEERTIVEVDLTQPGSVAGEGAVHPAPNEPQVEPQGPGAFIETGFETTYRMPVHCGIEWLGPLNDVTWRTEDPDGSTDFVPDAWTPLVNDGRLDVTVLLEEGPTPRLTASANGHSVVYLPSPDAPPGCD